MAKSSLDHFFTPGPAAPPPEAMIAKAFEILRFSPHGGQLADFAAARSVRVNVIATPQPVAYLPEPRLICIGFNRNHPIAPARFILMLAGALREAQQEDAGIHHPQLHAPLDEHISVSMAKYEDKLWYMCTIALELGEDENLTEYNFLDELRKMGHNEALELYLRQERG